MNYKAIYITGNINFYKHSGFEAAYKKKIRYKDLSIDSPFLNLLVKELKKDEQLI